MTRTETPWGVWDAIGPAEMADLMRGFAGWWCIAGGYAIDAFCGRDDRREHGDVDVSLLARDQLAAQSHFGDWELECADPPGSLRPWLPGEMLPAEVHDIWARRDDRDPWRFQLMLNPAHGGDWLFRRDHRIRRRLADLTWECDGIPYLAPEVQLLFKSGGLRPKDVQDFDDALPLLSPDQRGWLAHALALTSPGHAWLARL